MSITASTHTKWAISRDGGSTWIDFPKGPTGAPVPTAMQDDEMDLHGRSVLGRYYSLELSFAKMTPVWFLSLMAMYSPSSQDIMLNYQSNDSTVDGSGNTVEKWYYAPAVWGKRPTYEREGLYYNNVTVVFDMVEWWVPS